MAAAESRDMVTPYEVILEFEPGVGLMAPLEQVLKARQWHVTKNPAFGILRGHTKSEQRADFGIDGMTDRSGKYLLPEYRLMAIVGETAECSYIRMTIFQVGAAAIVELDKICLDLAKISGIKKSFIRAR